MNKFSALLASVVCSVLPAGAQGLSLDSCRAMALRSNKQLGVARAKQQIAVNVRKAARTQYLPHVDVAGGWLWSSKEISLLNTDQKNALTGAGSNMATSLSQNFTSTITELVQGGVLSPQVAQALGEKMSGYGSQVANYGDALGEKVKDAFRTDTRNIFAGSVVLRQPIFMGGAITAANNIADITEKMAATQLDASEQTILYNIDNAYWTVVSLRQKQRLAESYLNLVAKLDDDVHKMINEGVATRADGLKVDVRVNEAEMTKSQVDNGLELSRMLLNQLCGMPLENNVTLADENSDDITMTQMEAATFDTTAVDNNRPELQLLENSVSLTEQATKLVRASMLPQVALVGGYFISNPNVFNGFEKKFSGVWNVGLMFRVPVFDWGEGIYKVRASKIATDMARYELNDAKEKIRLQVSQCNYRLKEANKKLAVAQRNIQRAEENLRCANVGFKEGVMESTDVMAAQTAWLQAQTQKIDAQIEVCMGEAAMRKALGIK